MDTCVILSDTTLRHLVEKGEIGVDPLGENAIQPASVDCRLGNTFLLMKSQEEQKTIDMDEEFSYEKICQDTFVLAPHTFILATTQEYITLPANVTAFVEGRSSIGRLGLFIQNAGWVDPGFHGSITLELYNASPLPIKLCAGRRICQLVFCFMDQKAASPYAGKYQGQKGTMGSLIHKDSESRHENIL